MRGVAITGAGVVSPLGDSPAALHEALCAGASGLKPIELFPTGAAGDPGAPQADAPQAGEIRPFDAAGYLPGRNLRPVDRTARLLLVAAQQALAESGWDDARRREREVGLALGTTFCSVRTIAEFDRRSLELGPQHSSPLDFANSVINAAAGQAAIWFGLRGVNSTLSGGEASALQAIAFAADLVAGGRAEAMLAGGAEELCFESWLGHRRAGRLWSANGHGERLVPFEARRSGFALAEGAALVMLEPAAAARRRGARVLAEVLGHGAAFDHGGDGGSGSVEALARAVREALDDAGLAPADLDCAFVSASGSVEGDRAEALGLAAALDGRAAGLPVAAVKGMLGEALGASGGFQAVALLGTLGDGRLPGIPGLERTEDGFPLAAAARETRTLQVRRGLLTAVGADGHCAALVLGAPEPEEGR